MPAVDFHMYFLSERSKFNQMHGITFVILDNGLFFIIMLLQISYANC